jgi:hypothetical protein
VGLEVSPGNIRKNCLLQVQLAYQTLQACILLFQLLQSLGLINLHAAILTSPAVVALISRSSFAAGTEYILTLTYLDLNLAQLGHDLLGL